MKLQRKKKIVEKKYRKKVRMKQTDRQIKGKEKEEKNRQKYRKKNRMAARKTFACLHKVIVHVFQGMLDVKCLVFVQLNKCHSQHSAVKLTWQGISPHCSWRDYHRA